MPERRATVGGEHYFITVDQKSKSVWVAVGDYMGETLRVQGRSEGVAVKRWREAAEYRGNRG